MNTPNDDPAMPTKTSSSEQQAIPSDRDPCFEQLMAELDLSSDTRSFMRKLHLAEKKLNDAFDAAHQGADLDECASHIYHDLYRSR